MVCYRPGGVHRRGEGMSLDHSRLQIHKLVMHQVPKRFVTRQADGPGLAEIECRLSPESAHLFERRISRSLETAACDILLDSESVTPVSQLIDQYLRAGNSE